MFAWASVQAIFCTPGLNFFAEMDPLVRKGTDFA